MKVRFVSLLAASLTLAFALTACGSSDQGALPTYTPGSASKTTAGPPATTPTKLPPTDSGPDSVPADSTHTYGGGLKVVVDLPAVIPAAWRPSLRLFSEFIQTVGRSLAQNELDPAMSGLASVDVVKLYLPKTGPEATQEIGTVIYTVTKVDTDIAGLALVSGCLDQSKVAQVRKDGSHLADPDGRKWPTLKMTMEINLNERGLQVSTVAFRAVPC